MDLGVFRGLMTLLIMSLFVGIVVWAWGGKRKRDFDAAARLPLEDDTANADGRKRRDQ